MDHFGIGSAVRGALQVYFSTARRTGRTTSLVESLKTGDRVVFVDRREAERVKRLCAERNVKIETVVCGVNDIGRLFERGSRPDEGRTIFDHTWVEHLYLAAVCRAERDIDEFQKLLSGQGADHKSTIRPSQNRVGWNGFDDAT